MTYFAFPRSIRHSSVAFLLVFSACYSTIKHDEKRSPKDGAVPEKDVAFGDQNGSRYTVIGSTSDATVTDRVTELIWQLDSQSEMTYNEAIDYCSKLELGGYRDWRLPDESELSTLVDLNKQNPASSFPNMPIDWFWTSTESFIDDRFARFIRFDQGDVLLADKENSYAVRCVRG